MQRPHIVQPVRKLDEQDADVFGHGEDEFAEIFRLLGGLVRLKLDASQLRHAVHEPRNFGPELLFDVGKRDVRILDRVVQQRGGDRGAVHFHFGQNARDFERMRKIGVARRPHLRSVGLHGKDISAVEKVFVRVRIIGLDALDQFVLAHKAGGLSFFRDVQGSRRLVFRLRPLFAFIRQAAPSLEC